jgi:NADPH:quinone reductase-like Zn-dependent oxidoreductase
MKILARELVVEDSFGLKNLRLRERELPAPGPGEVLVRLRAASLNYRDLLMVRGHYNPKQPLPLVPGSDGLGEVIATGPGVSTPKIGDRVATLFSQSWLAGALRREHRASTLGGPLPGTLREYGIFRAEGLASVPEHMSDFEAACLPCAALTAWSALVTHGQLRAGQKVLVIGTGGVALFAIQIAALHGAEIILVSRTQEKLQRARAAFPQAHLQTICSIEEPAWGLKARELAGGIDIAIELGGAGTLAKTLSAMNPGGQVSLIGVLAGTQAPLDLLPIIMSGLRVQGILVGAREGFEQMVEAFRAARTKPIIDQVFPLSDAASAFEALASGQHFGKLCLDLSR